MRFYITNETPASLLNNKHFFATRLSLFTDVFFPHKMGFSERTQGFGQDRLAGGTRTCFFAVHARALACLKH